MEAVTLPTIVESALATAGGFSVVMTGLLVLRRRRSRRHLVQRERLLQRLSRSPLRKMLLLRHLDTETYIKATSTASLDLHLTICRECPKKKLCEEALREGRVDSFWYCQNATMIERLHRDERSA